MYKNILQSIDNIEIWPVISFVIFFIFFLCLLWWVFTADKKFIAKMAAMPIENDNESMDSSTLKKSAL